MKFVAFKRWSASHTEKAWSVYIQLPFLWLFVFTLAKHRT